jgi:hypothetical protein
MQEQEHIDRSLADALRALAEEDTREGASDAVRTRLLADVRSRGRARRRAGVTTALAIAATVVIAVAIAGWRVSWPLSSGTPLVETSGDETATAFFPLFYAGVPMTEGQIVRLEVSTSVLASVGVAPADMPGDGRSATILADVLVGEDGLARAVRFVRPE